MRTPPPVLPPSGSEPSQYKPTWFDRVGPDAGIRLRGGAYAAAAGFIVVAVVMLFAGQGGSDVLFTALIGAIIAGGLVFVAVYYMSNKFADTAGAVAKAFTLPSGNSTPYEQGFSHQESLAIRGDVAGALESYEAIIAEQPTAIPPRMKAAEHYASGNRDPRRAAQLFREIRDIPGCSVRDAVYASTRLADLYDGPLGEPGRALVELRRIIEQYPDTPMAKHARAALPALKARLQSPGAN